LPTARSELPVSTRPNHQALRRPRSPHTEQPRFLAFVFAPGGHAPGTDQRHHGELQAFADVQGHHLEAVVRDVEHAGLVPAQLVRLFAFAQEVDAQVHLAQVAAEDGHVAQGMAFALAAPKCLTAYMGEVRKTFLILDNTVKLNRMRNICQPSHPFRPPKALPSCRPWACSFARGARRCG